MRASLAAMRAIGTDRRGATIVEFALIIPVVCMFLMGAFDVGHELFLTSTLQGAVQKAARDSALESGATTESAKALDDKLRAQILGVATNGTVDFSRRYYRTFSQAQQALAEPWVDSVPKDGTCNKGESYQDTNGNGVWDSDGGDGGQGGAKDKTVYTVTVTYKHLFPFWRYIGGSDTQVLSAKTVMQNQPYGDQGSYSTVVATRYCS